MKFKYSKEDDILMIFLSKENIADAEQFGDVIVHYDANNKVNLIEILDASVFFKQLILRFPRKIVHSIIPRRPSIAFKNK